MIEVISTLDTTRLLSWLESSIAPRLSPDVSNYSKGRMRAWLRIEPLLGDKYGSRTNPGIPMKDAHWDRLQDIINWKFDYCLVTFSGEFAVGITPHRDASYADYEAMGLNVNNSCKFSYWNNRDTFGRSASTGNYPVTGEPSHVINMTPGTLIRFNCKNPHSAQPNPNRWGINFWRAKS